MRQARLKAGLSLAQVAGTELTRQAVHLIETGKVRPSQRSLQIIARRLGVQPYSLQRPAGPVSELPDRRVAELDQLCERQRYADVVEQGLKVLAGDLPLLLQAYTHLYLGRALSYLARADEALKHLRRARKLFEAEEDPWLAAEALEWEGMGLYLKEDPRAAAIVEQALRRYRALEPRRPDVEARMLEHLATCLAQRGDFVRAHQSYTEALHVAGTVLDLARLGRTYHGMGYCQVSLGDRRLAIELFTRAVTLYAVENDLRPLAARIDLPRVENDLGMVLMLDGQLARAEELFMAALGHFEEAGVERMQSYVLLSFAELRQAQARLDESLELLERVIESTARLDERLALALAWQQLGGLREARQESELADESFDRALAIFAELGMAERKAECLAVYQRVLDARGHGARLEHAAG